MANFILEQCSSSNQFTVGFGVRFTPITGQTYSFSNGLTGETICGTIISGTTGSTTYSAITQYDNCNECIIDIPRSANTETVICYTCFSDVNNGTAFYYTNTVPHPVYTDGYGTPVTQLDMVTLGGVNGLNN
jgi:hypothetical protein